jgi:hypothetical protein
LLSLFFDSECFAASPVPVNGAALSKSRVDLSDDPRSDFAVERIAVSVGEQLFVQLNVTLVRRRERTVVENEVERDISALGSDDDHSHTRPLPS